MYGPDETCSHGVLMSERYCAGCRMVLYRERLKWAEEIVSECLAGIAEIEAVNSSSTEEKSGG
jgi:hypothetical protein